MAYDDDLRIWSDQIEKPQVLEIPLNPSKPGDPNMLCIYTGTTRGQPFKGESSGDWRGAKLTVTIPTEGRKWTNDPNRGFGWTLFKQGLAVAAPSSIYNAGHAVHAGWAVDAAWLEIKDRMTTEEFVVDECLVLRGLVAVRDSDGYLYRISYQATVLGTVLGPVFTPFDVSQAVREE